MTSNRTVSTGVIIGLVSAIGFGGSGPFVKPLLEGDWSPGAAVAVRALGAGLVLLPGALWGLRGRWRVIAEQWRPILLYALVGVAGIQVFYFSAVQRLPVSVALLMEYCAPVLLVAFHWARSRQAPPGLTLVGTFLAVVGLALVIDLTGGGDLDPLGLLFGFLASLCLAGYFTISARPRGPLPPVAQVCFGMLLGSGLLTLAGVAGILPFTASADQVVLLDRQVPWLVPMAVVAVFSTAFAYWTGLLSAARLGARMASFLGLAEVLFAVLFSWLLLSETPTAVQAVGGLLVVAGVVAVGMERPAEPAPTSPDAEVLTTV